MTNCVIHLKDACVLFQHMDIGQEYWMFSYRLWRVTSKSLSIQYKKTHNLGSGVIIAPLLSLLGLHGNAIDDLNIPPVCIQHLFQ